jgi:hypothetical protein
MSFNPQARSRHELKMDGIDVESGMSREAWRQKIQFNYKSKDTYQTWIDTLKFLGLQQMSDDLKEEVRGKARLQVYTLH